MLARFNGNVVPFADDATSTNRTVFGGTTQSDTLDDNLNDDFKKGWEIVDLNGNPTREDFNAMGYTLGALTSYLYEMGISEWNASQNYRIGSRVIGSDGKIYKALTGTVGAPNVNHNPTSDTANWIWELNQNMGSGTQSFNGFGGSGFKNYIINGNFDIWQYKDAGATYPQTSSGYGSDDRWANASTGSTKTHSQVFCTDFDRPYLNSFSFSRTVVTSVAGASNRVVKYQPIENITKLAGKTVTLSFWAKADSNKNIAIELTQSFGTGGTPSTSVTGIGSQLVSLTTTWQKKTITITIPSIIGKTLGTDGVHTSSLSLFFWFDAGADYNARSASLGQQSGTFDIAQVQLEEGSVATPFEQRPVGLELSLCQRYFEIIKGQVQGTAYTTSNLSFSANFLVEKRTPPTIIATAQGGWVGNGGTGSITTSLFTNALTTKGYGIDSTSFTGSVLQGYGYILRGFTHTASAEL